MEKGEHLTTSMMTCDKEFVGKVDTFIRAVLDSKDILGLSLTVVKGNKTIMTKGYGKLSLDSETDINENTMVGACSNTKAFTTLLHGIVLKENGYTWDTPVRDILGDDFRLYNDLLTHYTTSRDLAAHRTGVPRHNMLRLQELPRKDVVRKLRHLKPYYDFRCGYIYSNLMYCLITHMTEELAGMPWNELIRNRIFRPLHMDASSFTDEVMSVNQDIAQPYMKTADGTWRAVDLKHHGEWGKLGGSSSILSNATDMAKWLHVQLHDGKDENGERIFEKSLIEETQKPYNIVQRKPFESYYEECNIPVNMVMPFYGMGWRVGSYRGFPLVVHSGTSFGYGGYITMLKEQGIAIYTGITGTDSEYTGRLLIHMYIMDLLLGVEPWLAPDTAKTFPRPWLEVTKSSPALPKEISLSKPLDQYTGVYHNTAYGKIRFDINSSGKLQLQYSRNGNWELTPIGEHHFSGAGEGRVWMWRLRNIRFSTDSGRVAVDFDPYEQIEFTRDKSTEVTALF